MAQRPTQSRPHPLAIFNPYQQIAPVTPEARGLGGDDRILGLSDKGVKKAIRLRQQLRAYMKRHKQKNMNVP